MTLLFDKLLIANRGEIACRIMETAQRMGIRCVAVYSDADKNARHVTMADEAVHIGPAPAKDSYLRIDKILQAAECCGAQAIHPGYGFMSENVDFANACQAQGLIFIGPPVGAIAAMGSKSAAKTIMKDAGVPLVPGYHGDNQDFTFLKQTSEQIGYPQLLKAAFGGGGKGMRIVNSLSEFDAALAATKREAMAAFGNDQVLIERYLIKPRHIEIQIFSDSQGNSIYLSQRDCSIQRRHQKVLEEAPAPNLAEETQIAMGEAAVAAAQAINYQGAGTVEFLYDEDGSFYFMEMNTRLQVEHPVTEMITNVDLVEWQINIASGASLPKTQAQVEVNGHAIEVRIYAEDPDADFVPATGQLSYLHQPASSHHVRIDSGFVENDSISRFYDPMIAKLIVWDTTRELAIRRMQNALDDYHIGGLKTNLGFLSRLVGTTAFKVANLDTGFIEAHHKQLFHPPTAVSHMILSLAALSILLEQNQCSDTSAILSHEPGSPWSRTSGWRLNEPAHHHIELTDQNNEPHNINISQHGDTFVCLFNDNTGTHALEIKGQLIKDRLTAVINGHYINLYVNNTPEQISLFLPRDVYQFTKGGTSHIDTHVSGGQESKLTAPMHGVIVSLLCQPDRQVKAGETLMIMEAMKMEYSIVAPYDGTVTEICYQPGDTVKDGEQLLEITPQLKSTQSAKE